MNDRGVDLAVCDREPIHVPGSIQPHGVLLVADPESGLVRYGAGDVAGRVGRQDWLGLSVAELLGPAVSDAVGKEARGTLRQVRRLRLPRPSTSPFTAPADGTCWSWSLPGRRLRDDASAPVGGCGGRL